MRALCLTGWMQPYGALKAFAEALGYEADIIPYGDVASMAALQQEPREADLLIGWSLGGGLACHGLADGWLKTPKALLLSTPFSLSNTKGYDAFLTLYREHPEQAAEWLSRRIGITDRRKTEWQDHAIAGAWLEMLGAPFAEKVAVMPRRDMAILHAADDAVVPFAHGEKLAGSIGARLIRLDKGGHAPFKEAASVTAAKEWLHGQI
jgi:pimeloyl-ACP methyl ester carboxylesterase